MSCDNGFSHSTGLPAAIQARVSGAWNWIGRGDHDGIDIACR